MIRSSLMVALVLASCACSEQRSDEKRPDVAEASDASAGPAPEAKIVDLPMDSISNEDIEDDGAGNAIEEQTVVSDR